LQQSTLDPVAESARVIGQIEQPMPQLLFFFENRSDWIADLHLALTRSLKPHAVEGLQRDWSTRLVCGG